MDMQAVIARIQQMADSPKEAPIGWDSDMNTGYQAGYSRAAEDILELLQAEKN